MTYFKYILNLTNEEYEVLQSLAKQQELDTDRVLIQSLRMYQATVNPPPDPPFMMPAGKTVALREYVEGLKPKPKFLISFRTYGRARINGGYTETRIIEGSVVDWWKNEDNWRLGPSDGIDGCTILMVHEIKE